MTEFKKLTEEQLSTIGIMLSVKRENDLEGLVRTIQSVTGITDHIQLSEAINQVLGVDELPGEEFTDEIPWEEGHGDDRE